VKHHHIYSGHGSGHSGHGSGHSGHGSGQKVYLNEMF